MISYSSVVLSRCRIREGKRVVYCTVESWMQWKSRLRRLKIKDPGKNVAVVSHQWEGEAA